MRGLDQDVVLERGPHLVRITLLGESSKTLLFLYSAGKEDNRRRRMKNVLSG